MTMWLCEYMFLVCTIDLLLGTQWPDATIYTHMIFIPICSVLEDLPTKRAEIVWINLGKYSSTEIWDRTYHATYGLISC